MTSQKGLFRKEEELFLLLARSVLSNEQKERALLLMRDEINWAAFVKLCRRFKLCHVIAFSLNSIGGEGLVPNELLTSLNGLLCSAIVRNEFRMLGHHLPAILSALNKRGLESILLKGPAVAMTYYPRACLRLFADLDLLIKQDALPEAVEALSDDGFVMPESFREKLKRSLEEGKSYPPLAKMDGSGQIITVDLHWQLSEKRPMDESRFWEMARPFELHGAHGLIPSPEHALFHAITHAADHGFSPHVWNGSRLTMLCVCDINQIRGGSGEDFDWNEIIRMAGFSRARPHCYNYLRLSHHLLETETDQSVLLALLDNDKHPYGDREWGTIALSFIRKQPDDVMRYAYNLLIRKDVSWSRRLKRMRRKCFPAINAVARYYGVSPRSPLKYYCYIRRLFRPSIVRKGLVLSFRLAQVLLRTVFVR